MRPLTRIAAVACTAIMGLSTQAVAQANPVADLANQALASNSSRALIPAELMPLDELGRPKPEILSQARVVAQTLPPELRAAVLSGVAFFEGDGESDVDVPQGNVNFTQFYWPTVSGKCIGGTQDSVGSAIAVPGPTEIPAPGAKAGETAFLFTALGTSALSGKQAMNVQWFNIDTLKWGITPLGDNGINKEGPATVSGTAKTGKGRIVAVVSGTVNTKDAGCRFIPTAAFFEVK